MHTLNRRKGQSLIEVVVALGILAAVFATAATLIVTIVDLNVSARSRTEAVALAQKKLTEKVKEAKKFCGTSIASDSRTCGWGPGGRYCLEAEVIPGKYFSGAGGTYSFAYDSNPANQKYVNIIVTVDWKDKSITNNYEISQIVGLNE